jgi:hypothetical protein
MITFTITPRSKGFWIERTDHDGSRAVIERLATEPEALRRVQVLREQAETIEIHTIVRRPGRKARS